MTDYIKITLTQGKVALIDAADLPLVGMMKWHAALTGPRRNRRWYAATKRSRTAARADGLPRGVMMHRLVMGAAANQDVDHVSGDGLDNRRENLRFATCSQNQANARKYRGRWAFKGIYRVSPGCWAAQIGPERQYLGCFMTAVDAAVAYDEAARNHWGSYAHLNFPEQRN